MTVQLPDWLTDPEPPEWLNLSLTRGPKAPSSDEAERRLMAAAAFARAHRERDAELARQDRRLLAPQHRALFDETQRVTGRHDAAYYADLERRALVALGGI